MGYTIEFSGPITVEGYLNQNSIFNSNINPHGSISNALGDSTITVDAGGNIKITAGAKPSLLRRFEGGTRGRTEALLSIAGKYKIRRETTDPEAVKVRSISSATLSVTTELINQGESSIHAEARCDVCFFLAEPWKHDRKRCWEDLNLATRNKVQQNMEFKNPIADLKTDTVYDFSIAILLEVQKYADDGKGIGVAKFGASPGIANFELFIINEELLTKEVQQEFKA